MNSVPLFQALRLLCSSVGRLQFSLPTRLVFPLLLACFALSPQARAVCQEGCDFPLPNTFLGDDALINNATGVNNTAIGSFALQSNTTGSEKTATGQGALNIILPLSQPRERRLMSASRITSRAVSFLGRMRTVAPGHKIRLREIR